MKNKLQKFLNNYKLWSPPKILIYMLLVLFTLFITLNSFTLDNDFWFLINMGKYILNNGIPTVEPFTMHADLSITVQQWLTDIIFETIYSNLGTYGMYVFISIISLIITLIVYKLSTLISNNKTKISFFIAIIIVALTNKLFITTRPQIFDCLFLLLEIYLLELSIKKNNKLYLLGLPIISLALINLHASIWLMSFVILIPYFIDRIFKLKSFDNDNYSLKWLTIITTMMFIISFINPYGIDAISYIFKSYGIDNINNFVGEMKAITINEPLGIIIYSLIFTILFSYYYNKPNKSKFRYFLLFLGTCYLGLSHYKGILFLLIGCIPALSYNFKNLTTEIPNRDIFYKTNKMNIFMLCIFIVYAAIYGYAIYKSDMIEKNINYLNNIANYLEENATKDSKIYTGYNDGGYLEYRGYKCYIDPRAEVFLKSNNKKEDIFDEYIKLITGSMNYKTFLDKYKFDYLVVSEEELMYNQIQTSDGYEIVYEEELKPNFNPQTSIKYRIFKRIEV